MDSNNYEMETSIFIAGATGVLGRRVVPQLVESGCHVTAVGRSQAARRQLQRAGATPVELDLFDPAAVNRVVAGHDVVINLATNIPSLAWMFLPGAWRMTGRIRTEASANLVNAALAGGANRYIQESFAPIYPDCGNRWIDETILPRPAKYNRAVLDAEAAANRFTGPGRTGIALRFAYFYGPDSAMTLAMIRSVQRGWAPVFGAPQAYFSSVSHDDAAGAVVAALGLPAGIYNVVDDEPLERREFTGSLADLLGVPSPRYAPPWVVNLMGSLGETLARSQRISNHKLKSASGWAPRYPSVREGWKAVFASIESGRPTSLVKPTS